MVPKLGAVEWKHPVRLMGCVVIAAVRGGIRGLLAYGPDIQALYRRAAGMARKVLHGAKVAELPAERPTRFQLVANLRTAKLFGVTLPPSILLRADEVIE
jgi:ABC-type uncharacterized transport system substrate-binding protein